MLIFGATFLWGLWAFFAKIASDKIGVQASLWDSITLIFAIIIYLGLTKELSNLKADKFGITMALLAGLCAGVASVFFFIVIQKKPAGIVITLSSLYPIITILLSLVFLKENLTLNKILGFIFAFIAIFLLNL